MINIKLSKGSKVGHLTLKNEVGICRNTIFLGPNGSGKSTLYAQICTKIDEKDILKITDKDILSDAFDIKDDSFIIKANINKVYEVENDILEIENKQGNVTKTGLPPKFEKDIYKNPKILSRTSLIIPRSEAIKEIFATKKMHSKIWKAKGELDKNRDSANRILTEDRDFVEKIYNHLEKNESDKCFVCQGDINYKDILETWRTKLEEIKVKIEYDIPVLSSLNESMKNEFYDYILNNTYEDIFAAIACDFDNEKFETFKQNSIKLASLKEQLENYKSEAVKLYESLSNESNRTFTKNFFVNFYGIKKPEENIVFDDENSEVHIKLDRAMQMYSSGEKNLLLIYLKIQGFLYSDKNTLIVDDFITSLDYANMCLISRFIEEITSIDENKHFILFTHNVSFAYSLSSKSADSLWVDRVGDNLFLMKFEGQQLNKIRDVLSKDDWFEHVFEPEVKVNKVCHYDKEKNNDDDKNLKYRNQLLNFVNDKSLNYNDFSDFDQMLAFKEKIFLSIRINIEKMIFNIINLCQTKDELITKYNNSKTVMQRLNIASKVPEFVKMWNNKYINLSIDSLLKSKISISNFSKHNEIEKEELDLFLFNPILNINLDYLKREHYLIRSVLIK
jgi:ABC-type multidrug transport system ATPase subunit